MALNTAVTWEVRTTGNNSNGGGFRTGASGTDRSQQDAAHAVLSTSSVIHSTTTQVNVAAGDHTVSAQDVGNIVQITGGTATPGFYEITVADVANNRWTLDRSAGTAGQTVVARMGGALANLGVLGGVLVSGNQVFVKAGTYAITSATANVVGGCFSTAANLLLEGYQATRGDLGTKPILQASGISSFTVITATSARVVIRNIEVDCASLATSRAFNCRGIGERLKASNCTNSGFVETTNVKWIRCEAVGCSTASAFLSGDFLWCVARDGSAPGFTLGLGNSAIGCIAEQLSGASTDGFTGTQPGTLISGCVAYAIDRDGFRLLEEGQYIENSIAEDCIGVGFNVGAHPR
jgi:hypothetical protein